MHVVTLHNLLSQPLVLRAKRHDLLELVETLLHPGDAALHRVHLTTQVTHAKHRLLKLRLAVVETALLTFQRLTRSLQLNWHGTHRHPTP